MEDEYDALNVRAFTQSRSDTGVNENVNKLLKFGTYSVKMTLNFVLLRMIIPIFVWYTGRCEGQKGPPTSSESRQSSNVLLTN